MDILNLFKIIRNIYMNKKITKMFKKKITKCCPCDFVIFNTEMIEYDYNMVCMLYVF